MNPMTFLSRRFETHLEGQLRFGDVVIDEYGDKGVVVKNPYPVGTDRDLFVTVYSGYFLKSAPTTKFRKTGKSYANELNTIFNGLKEETDNEGVHNQ